MNELNFDLFKDRLYGELTNFRGHVKSNQQHREKVLNGYAFIKSLVERGIDVNSKA